MGTAKIVRRETLDVQIGRKWWLVALNDTKVALPRKRISSWLPSAVRVTVKPSCSSLLVKGFFFSSFGLRSSAMIQATVKIPENQYTAFILAL